VLHKHGRPRTIREEGCSFITRRERFWVKLSVNTTEIFTDSQINPAVTGLPLKRHSATGVIYRFKYKGRRGFQR